MQATGGGFVILIVNINWAAINARIQAPGLLTRPRFRAPRFAQRG
jgi:hypothetical protein